VYRIAFLLDVVAVEMVEIQVIKAIQELRRQYLPLRLLAFQQLLHKAVAAELVKERVNKLVAQAGQAVAVMVVIMAELVIITQALLNKVIQAVKALVVVPAVVVVPAL
jgi:2-phospho-L-lactate guanylyltransferase (CobY/MobA/RfbA family)